MNLSIILALLFSVTVVMPVLDIHKSFVPFCRQITAIVPVGERIYAYQPDETLRGAVPFYTGRYVIETEEFASVETMLQKEEPFYIIIRDKREETEKKLLNSGQTFFSRETTDGDRPNACASFKQGNTENSNNKGPPWRERPM